MNSNFNTTWLHDAEKEEEKYERWGDIKDQFSFCKLPGWFQLYEHGLGCQKKASFRYDMNFPGSTENNNLTRKLKIKLFQLNSHSKALFTTKSIIELLKGTFKRAKFISKTEKLKEISCHVITVRPGIYSIIPQEGSISRLQQQFEKCAFISRILIFNILNAADR